MAWVGFRHLERSGLDHSVGQLSRNRIPGDLAQLSALKSHRASHYMEFFRNHSMVSEVVRMEIYHYRLSL
jgi:hypothetical protein